MNTRLSHTVIIALLLICHSGFCQYGGKIKQREIITTCKCLAVLSHNTNNIDEKRAFLFTYDFIKKYVRVKDSIKTYDKYFKELCMNNITILFPVKVPKGKSGMNESGWVNVKLDTSSTIFNPILKSKSIIERP